MFEDKKKLSKDMRVPGSGVRKVMNESKDVGRMFGNHGTGSGYPVAQHEEFAKGMPKKMPGQQNMCHPNMDESKSDGRDNGNYDSKGKGARYSSSKQPDGLHPHNSKGHKNPDPHVTKSNQQPDSKSHRKNLAMMVVEKKMKKKY